MTDTEMMVLQKAGYTDKEIIGLSLVHGTDPKVKQALLDLCDVMQRLTKLVDSLDQRLTTLEKQFNPPALKRTRKSL